MYSFFFHVGGSWWILHTVQYIVKWKVNNFDFLRLLYRQYYCYCMIQENMKAFHKEGLVAISILSRNIIYDFDIFILGKIGKDTVL
jgi:hypothetical protein